MFKQAYPHFNDIFNTTLYHLCGMDMDDPNSFVARSMRETCEDCLGVTDDILESNPNMKLKDYMRLKILKDFGINRNQGPYCFLRGIIRISCSNEINIFGPSEDKDLKKLRLFKNLIDFLYKNGIQLSEDLDGLSFGELNKQYGTMMRQHGFTNWLNNRDNNINDSAMGDYVVKHIPNYATASQYSSYTSWCVTHGQSHFNSYTGRGEQFFFCLRKGFENVEPTVGEGCPLDEYGLSMVSVCVKPNGVPSYITTRWNHAHDGENNPKLRTLEQVEEVLGIPKSTFTEHMRPDIELDDVPFLLKQKNIKLEDIFSYIRPIKNGLTIVGFNVEKDSAYSWEEYLTYNIIKDNQLLSNVWFERCIARDDYIFVQYEDDTCNLYDFNGEKIFDKNLNGSPRTFDEEKGIYLIINDREYPSIWNLVTKSGDPIIPNNNLTFIAKEPHEGYTIVFDRYRNMNFLDENYQLVWKEFKENDVWTPPGTKIEMAWKYGIYIQKKYVNGDAKYRYISIKTGEPLNKMWFDKCEPFELKRGNVTLDDKRNYVKLDGQLMSEQWFDHVATSVNDYTIVTIKDVGENVVDPNGNLVLNKWWKKIYFYDGEYGCGTIDDTNVVFKGQDEIIFKTSYACFRRFPNGTYLSIDFTDGCKVNILRKDGSPIIDGNLEMCKERQGAWEDPHGNIYDINYKTGDLTKIN